MKLDKISRSELEAQLVRMEAELNALRQHPSPPPAAGRREEAAPLLEMMRAALRETEQRYRALVESSADAIIAKSLDGVIQSWNAGAEAVYGYTAAEVIGQPISILIPRDHPDELHEFMEKIRRGERIVRYQTVRMRKDGQPIHVALTISPIRDTEGKVVGASTIARDITDRVRAEEALRASQARVAGIVETAMDAVMSVDHNQRVVLFNAAAAQMFRCSVEEALHQPLERFIPERFRAAHHEHVRHFGESGATARRMGTLGELSGLRADGEEFPMEASISHVKVGEERIFTVVMRDITVRKRAEEALRDNERRFRELVESLPDMVWSCQTDGFFDFFSRQAADYTGVPQSEQLGYGWMEQVHPEDQEKLITAWQGSLKSGAPFGAEFRIHGKDGHYRWFRARGVPLRDAQGRIVKWFGTTADIDDEKQASESLQQALTELATTKQHLEQRVVERTAELERRSAQLRTLASELTRAEERERRRVGQILHDHLQQLLVGARFNLDILRAWTQDRSFQQRVKGVEHALNEAFDTSRLLSYELSPPVLYQAGLAAALEWLGEWYQERHGLAVNVAADPRAVVADESLRIALFHAVREMLLNIVKHAKVKSAQVRLSRLKDDRVQIVVSDDGTGFDPAQIRAKGGRTGGFGLFGLRERIELLGGQLEMESAPGSGSRVTISAPLHTLADGSTPDPAFAPEMLPATRHPKAHPHKKLPEVRRIRVLLADDHSIVRDGLAQMLGTEPDLEVVGQAEDGEQTVELARSLHPDVVLMDVSMPRLNGIEATRRLSSEMPKVRVIGLSMYEDAAHNSAMREAGAVTYLKKSGPSDKLVAAIRKCAVPARARTR